MASLFVRPHCIQSVHRCSSLLQMSHVAWTVCLSVHLVLAWSVQKLLNWSRCSLGLTRVGPRNCVLDGVQIPNGNGHFWGRSYAGAS